MATIAIVDDDENISLMLKDFLERKGFKVWLALDPSQFSVLLKDNKPDLVIMDIQMPGGNGITAVKNLRKSPDTKDIPVIILSAMPLTLQRQWLADTTSGVRHLEKPADLMRLLKDVNEMLKA